MKKRMFIVMFLCLMFLALEPVMAADIASCEGAIKGAIIDEKIPNLVSTIITVIKIAVPVLLVIFGMIDLVKGITSVKEDEIKKGRQIFFKRLIYGALVFLVVTIVQLIISFVADEGDKSDIATCSKCFITGDCSYKKNDDGSCPSGKKLSENGKVCVK